MLRVRRAPTRATRNSATPSARCNGHRAALPALPAHATVPCQRPGRRSGALCPQAARVQCQNAACADRSACSTYILHPHPACIPLLLPSYCCCTTQHNYQARLLQPALLPACLPAVCPPAAEPSASKYMAVTAPATAHSHSEAPPATASAAASAAAIAAAAAAPFRPAAPGA